MGVSTYGNSERKEEDKFSESNWGFATIAYIQSVSKVSEKAWVKIVSGAEEFMAPSRGKIASINLLGLDGVAADADTRGLLFEPDSD